MVERIENDFYSTPENLTRLLLAHQPTIGGTILEPCAGQNAIANVLRERGFSVTATDITDGAEFDATTSSYWANLKPHHWIVTNPPFNQAVPILENSLSHADKGVAMLLRITFLEPCKNRRELLHLYSDKMVKFIPINPRVKFRKDTKGSDNATVGWYVWLKAWSWKELGIKPPFAFDIKL